MDLVKEPYKPYMDHYFDPEKNNIVLDLVAKNDVKIKRTQEQMNMIKNVYVNHRRVETEIFQKDNGMFFGKDNDISNGKGNGVSIEKDSENSTGKDKKKLVSQSFDCKINTPLHNLKGVTLNSNKLDRDSLLKIFNKSFMQEENTRESNLFMNKKKPYKNIFQSYGDTTNSYNTRQSMTNYNMKQSNLNAYNETENIFNNEERKNSMPSTYCNPRNFVINKPPNIERGKATNKSLYENSIVIVKNNKLHKIPRELFTAFPDQMFDTNKANILKDFLKANRINSSKYDYSVFRPNFQV